MIDMDLQEAIRLIHPDTSREEIWKHKEYGNKEKMIDVIEKACEMVCDAAGRQIAREVKEFEWYEDEQYVVWVCPVCGTSHTSGYEANYCSECGKALEWKHEKVL